MKREYRTPCRKHSRKSNVIVTRPKMARYDVYTLIKIGIDRRGFLPPLPQCFQQILHSEVKNWSGAYGTAARTLGVRSNGNVDLKIHHGITCTSCYFPESVSYTDFGCLILSLHYGQPGEKVLYHQIRSIHQKNSSFVPVSL